MDLKLGFLIIIGLIIIIIVLIIINKIRIRLFFIKLRNGKYSHDYIQFFKDHNIRSPYDPCLKDDLLLRFLVFVEKNNKSHIFNTEKTIQFGNSVFLTNCNQIFKANGKPNCFNTIQINGLDLKVIGYRETIFENNIKALYYCVNDAYIMGEYIFSDVSRTNSDNLIELLWKKYKIKSKIDTETFYIEDENKTQIYFENNGFEISLKYMYKKNAENFKLIENELNYFLFNKGENLKNDYQKQLFDKL